MVADDPRRDGQREFDRWSDRSRQPFTSASRHQAVTSPSAAHPIAVLPSSLPFRPRSVMIRASTGKAVTLIAIPVNNANVRNGTPGGA